MTDDKIAAPANVASGELAPVETSIALPKASDRIARLASWAVTDPNQLKPTFFSFKDICCVLKSNGKPKVLLDMVSGVSTYDSEATESSLGFSEAVSGSFVEERLRQNRIADGPSFL